jgi:hypothetical protein
MNLEDIDITADDPQTDDPPDSVREPMTDDYDIFQGDVMSYSQLMSQMSIDSSTDTSSTQYEPTRASPLHSSSRDSAG